MHPNALEDLVVLVISYVVPLVEACGAAVIVLGVIRTIVQYVRSGFRLNVNRLIGMRSQLAPSLVMGLDFQLAADVLKTAVAPTWNQILMLGALIGLRTALTYLLERGLHTLETPAQPKESHGAEQGMREA